MKVWQFAAEISGLMTQCRGYMYAIDQLRESEKMEEGEGRETLIKVYRRQSYSAARRVLACSRAIAEGMEGLRSREFKEFGEFLEEYGNQLEEYLEIAGSGREAGA